jgi:hypothetical protein
VGVYLITRGRAGVLPQAAAIEQEKLLVKEGYKATHRVNIFPCKCAVPAAASTPTPALTFPAAGDGYAYWLTHVIDSLYSCVVTVMLLTNLITYLYSCVVTVMLLTNLITYLYSCVVTVMLLTLTNLIA